MPRTDEAAYAIPRRPAEVVATYLIDADHANCIRFRERQGIERFNRGLNFEEILALMDADPCNLFIFTFSHARGLYT